ncbi:putative RNA-directed DNA polymerase from mobile element jockey-like [Apostichopus japonicus]|uniref:Putative RNA-directed DNA polymerase from mobile element jockey-like n=1 Tax=Stichopus japonicus TaxID=307972 RepID=A0A2G8JIH2_STIJA|nr:putative RNA-directed DNA polymerase from mobile element jockey-like [Apostichopus japonicus]
MKSPSSSCSLDPIPMDVLKSCLDLLLPHITSIVNYSLSTGVIPESLKSAQVVPILKKTNLNKNNQQNYRPISNLKFIFKTIERAAAAQINDYLQREGLHAPKQSAYRKHHSTETAMLRIQNDLLEAVDHCQEAVLVLLDFSAAFDTIDHDIILERLQNRYGILATARKWFESYLRGRSFSVNIRGARSIPRNLNDGVPQGSVLGPSIFAMYVAPLGDIVSAHASFALYKIGQLAKYLDHKSTERLVHAFITSRLDYCNSLLYGIPSTELSKLQLIQNSAARLVTRSKKHDHITPILRDLHWLPLHLRIRYKVALLAFKAIHGMAPSYLTDLVASYSPQRRLRSSSETLFVVLAGATLDSTETDVSALQLPKSGTICLGTFVKHLILTVLRKI